MRIKAAENQRVFVKANILLKKHSETWLILRKKSIWTFIDIDAGTLL
jgi:hypothetical protein